RRFAQAWHEVRPGSLNRGQQISNSSEELLSNWLTTLLALTNRIQQYNRPLGAFCWGCPLRCITFTRIAIGCSTSLTFLHFATLVTFLRFCYQITFFRPYFQLWKIPVIPHIELLLSRRGRPVKVYCHRSSGMGFHHCPVLERREVYFRN
ncbi:hypothetical protein KL905_005434, partial [Ogataea polymorpha]